MPKFSEDVSIDLVNEFFVLDRDAGVVVWRKSPAKNVYAGEVAGCVKACRKDKDGNEKSYSYVRIGGHHIPTSRVVWALAYGEWPNGRISFIDGNTLNLSVENLSLNKSLPKPFNFDDAEDRKEYYKEHRKVFKIDHADKHLQRKYGITIHDYGKMLVAQNGKCAICGSEEAGNREGQPKAFAVDHDHKTGKIRGLLCESCNQGIGKLKDDPDILRKAADYLETHHLASKAVGGI